MGIMAVLPTMDRRQFCRLIFRSLILMRRLSRRMQRRQHRKRLALDDRPARDRVRSVLGSLLADRAALCKRGVAATQRRDGDCVLRQAESMTNSGVFRLNSIHDCAVNCGMTYAVLCRDFAV